MKSRVIPEIQVHGAMLYRCERCCHKQGMWLEKGLEDPIQDELYPELHKPVPFIITCPECGGSMKHIRWDRDLKLGEYTPILRGRSYFRNDPNHHCGIPAIAGEEE
ncbi:hypothetical protein NIA71_08220 [Ihubacter massiliensis]|uniref:hypothetical protein n=1 Tax=Ihubacter massiliensis TaxID=1852367 RepID=UPI002096A834|nr:hypothetical protein [Ihubacter massiliensis]MCO7121935.1 hypothetical protein [Ihubacter massiliensis]